MPKVLIKDYVLLEKDDSIALLIEKESLKFNIENFSLSRDYGISLKREKDVICFDDLEDSIVKKIVKLKALKIALLNKGDIESAFLFNFFPNKK